MPSEAAAHADFSLIRYAQVWEDADILIEALAIRPDDTCLSIASAGDNALALLAAGPRKVVAIDLSAAQLACLALRVEAFRVLENDEIRVLIGSRHGTRRPALYAALRAGLPPAVRQFWDARPDVIARGIGQGGKFENYFRLFRERVLPLVHSRRTVARLLEPRDREARHRFYEDTWNTWRWRTLFHLFFSRTVMGALGRDPSFFRHVQGSVAGKILGRTRHALTELDPQTNPYLQWILTGTHGAALPFYLRDENIPRIREHLDRLEWRQGPVEDALTDFPAGEFSKFNLSDLFEYLSEENSARLLTHIARVGRPGGRLAYWNMLAPRSAPSDAGLRAVAPLGPQLLQKDKAFFYSAFVVEEIAP